MPTGAVAITQRAIAALGGMERFVDSGDEVLYPAVDQRGLLRPWDGDGDGAARSDRGAVELGAPLFVDGFESGDSSAWSDFDPWLSVNGNHIVRGDGSAWHGRGANIHDTRSCWACAWGPPDVAEVTRRIDELVDDWNADFCSDTSDPLCVNPDDPCITNPDDPACSDDYCTMFPDDPACSDHCIQNPDDPDCWY